MSDHPLHPNRRNWRGSCTHVSAPQLGRAITLETPPNVFILLADNACNDAARAVFDALLAKKTETHVMRFYTASSCEEAVSYIAACAESFTVNPVVITGTNERKSFKPYAHSVLSHGHFKRKGIESFADWMIEVSAAAPEKCIAQCAHSLALWFGSGNFSNLTSKRTEGSIVVPWGTLPAKDRLILL